MTFTSLSVSIDTMPLDRREDPDAMVCDDEVRTDEEEA